MAKDSKIEWCDHTINFWWGCTKVSPACANCYAERRDKQFHPAEAISIARIPEGDAIKVASHWGPTAQRLLRVEAAREEALRYEKQAVKEGRRFRVFTNSMSDFFEDRASLVEARQEALDTIMATPHLDWLILTKRPEKILPMLAQAQSRALDGDMGFAYTAPGTNALSEWLGWWLSGKAPANVWLGTTVEDQERADQRIPALLEVPAAVRFLSCEPLLGPVLLDNSESSWLSCHGSEPGEECCESMSCFGHHFRGIDWVIAGGESGPHARPMHPDWARGLRDQCAAAGVPFLFKQWGEHLPAQIVGHQTTRAHFGDAVPMNAHWAEMDPTTRAFKIGKTRAGRLLDGIEHNGIPQHAKSSA